MARVAVAMSGGVDSAVAAALLVAERHEVVGITMNLWPPWVPQPGEGSGCCGCGASDHYARVDRGPDGRSRLLRAADPQKDQSYVLAGLTQEQLAYLRFPVGAYTKAQIRDIARRHGLSVAGKPDSQEICFVPDGDYAAVVARFEPEALRPGPIYDRDGRRLGEHRGLARYTVGQRRGLGLARGSRRYVVEIDPGRNALVVGD